MFSNSPKIRQAIYALAVASQVASFFVALINAELAAAFLSTSGVLAAVAGVTALTNITPPVGSIDSYTPNVDGGFIDGNSGFNS